MMRRYNSLTLETKMLKGLKNLFGGIFKALKGISSILVGLPVGFALSVCTFSFYLVMEGVNILNVHVKRALGTNKKQLVYDPVLNAVTNFFYDATASICTKWALRYELKALEEIDKKAGQYLERKGYENKGGQYSAHVYPDLDPEAPADRDVDGKLGKLWQELGSLRVPSSYSQKKGEGNELKERLLPESTIKPRSAIRTSASELVPPSRRQ